MDETQNPDQIAVQQELARLMELLRTIVRMLGYTNRDIERRAGLPHTTTMRSLRGEGGPKLDFLLAVLRAVGLQPWEFFDLAYSERGEPSEAGQTLRRLLSQFTPLAARPAEKPALQARDVEEMLDELRREIRALAEKS